MLLRNYSSTAIVFYKSSAVAEMGDRGHNIGLTINQFISQLCKKIIIMEDNKSI